MPTHDTLDREKKTDPREEHAKPPFPEQKQQYPGTDTKLQPQADHGEQTYRGHGRLKDRAAIITGADSGIGRAVAIAFAREGADVLVSYLNEEDDAKETERWVRDAGRKCILMPGDIQDEDHCRQLVDHAMNDFGHVDLLINNAAFQATHNKIEEFSTAELDRTFRTNIYAMFFLCRAALPKMRPGSAIVNTASIQAYDPSPTLLAYAATKGAIVTFTKALSKMAAKQGVRVNAVAPGPVWTPLIPATMDPKHVEKFGADTPLGRAAQPAEIAPAFVFLASNDSSYITGEVIGVTGGEFLG